MNTTLLAQPITTSHAAAATWSIDPARSDVRFTARQMGMTVRGRFPGVEGTIEIQPDRLDASSVDAAVRTATVEPAMAALRGLLLSDSFLAAETHPELRFRSVSVESEPGGHLVHGELTFRGETRSVALHARLVSLDTSDGAASAAIEVTGRVDRLMADEELEVELSLHAIPADATAPRPQPIPSAQAPSRDSITRAPDHGDGDAGRAHEVRPLRLVGLVGSLRRGSLNRSLMHAAQEALPKGVTLEIVTLADLPFYDGDIEAAGDPASVRALKDAIRGADGVVIATPEYNQGLPAVIKNAIDWASRPAFASVLVGKPVLLIGAGTGRSGAKYALDSAAASLAFAQALPFEQRLGVTRAGELVDDDGRITHPSTVEQLGDVLSAFTSSIHDRAQAHQGVAA